MTLPELEALAERVVFRDWEPHFAPYGTCFLFWWTDGEFKTADNIIGGGYNPGPVSTIMFESAMEGARIQARSDFRVEPKGK